MEKPPGQLTPADAAANFPATMTPGEALATLQNLYADCVTHAVALAREANRRVDRIDKASHRDLMRGIQVTLGALPQVERLIAALQGRSELTLDERMEQMQALIAESKAELQRREGGAIDVTPKDGDDEVEADTEAAASAREPADDGGERPEAPLAPHGGPADSR